MPRPTQHLRFETGPDRLEHVLQVLIRPVLAALSGHPAVTSAWFARHRSQALLFLGEETDPSISVLQEVIEAHISPLRVDGSIRREKVATHASEAPRYGGTDGLRLAEKFFQEDSLACLDLLAAEFADRLPRSRREVSLRLTERLLDLFGFDRKTRIAVHRSSYSWALEQERWNADSVRLLESRYLGLREGLAALLAAPEEDVLGTEGAVALRAWEAATRPLVHAMLAAQGSGRIARQPQELAGSYAHLQCNRLGISGDAEAILRYFAQRLHEDGLGMVA